MELTTQDQQDTRIVTVMETRIDAAVAIQFKDRMRDLVTGAPGRVVLDLSRVKFIDSSGLGAVVASMKQAGSPARFELAGLTRNVAKVFALTRMDRVFTIHPSVAAIWSDVADAG